MVNLGPHTATVDFESLYIKLRESEGRIYSDEQVASFPNITDTHPHYKEWVIRKESSQKLLRWLKKKKKHVDILEIGCGNGWLSHQLATIPSSMVIGTDINFYEIQQAARVFQNISNLHFVFTYGNPELFKEKRFDVVIFAAAIQYFESFQDTIQKALSWLRNDGEIHILDSPFYSGSELLAARQRSCDYYESIGFKEMADYYFHHVYDDLNEFNYRILYQPAKLMTRLTGNKNPFPWIIIRPT
jgi:ubiquinone/menaquinone biosynthesis C-methylase UbiE